MSFSYYTNTLPHSSSCARSFSRYRVVWPRNYTFDLGLRSLSQSYTPMQSHGFILVLRPWIAILLLLLPLPRRFRPLPRHFCEVVTHVQVLFAIRPCSDISSPTPPLYPFGMKIGKTAVPGARITLGSNALDPDSDDGSVKETAEADVIEITSDSDQEPGQSPFLIVVWTMVSYLFSQVKSTSTNPYLGQFLCDGNPTLLQWRQLVSGGDIPDFSPPSAAELQDISTNVSGPRSPNAVANRGPLEHKAPGDPGPLPEHVIISALQAVFAHNAAGRSATGPPTRQILQLIAPHQSHFPARLRRCQFRFSMDLNVPLALITLLRSSLGVIGLRSALGWWNQGTRQLTWRLPSTRPTQFNQQHQRRLRKVRKQQIREQPTVAAALFLPSQGPGKAQ